MHAIDNQQSPVAPATPAAEPAARLTLRSVRDLYYVLFRRARGVALTFALVFVPVALIVLLRPPVYRSEARLMVRLGRQTVSLDPTVATGKTVGVQQSRINEINSELEILRSHDLLMEVVAAVHGPLGEEQLQAAAHAMSARLSILVLDESNVICVAYSDSDRLRAQAILAQLIERYLAKHIAVHTTEGSYEFFLAQAQQISDKIAHREQQVNELRKASGVASIADERRTLIERLASREGALEDLRTLLAAAQGSTTEDPALTRLREKLNELRVRELELMAHYEETSPVVASLRLQVAEVAELLAQQEALGRDRSSAGIEAQIRTVEQQAAVLRQRLDALNDTELAITGLELELELERESYRRYSESLEQARIDQALNSQQISNIGIVQPATLPAQPSGPAPAILLVLALFLAGSCALGTAFVLESCDDSIDTPERARAKLALPVLAALPDARGVGGAGPAPQSTRGLMRVHSELTGLCEQLREWAEARKRAFGGPERARAGRLPPGLLRLHQGEVSAIPAMVALTSCTPGNGVSTVAAGLAARLAKEGLKVLLVDARTTQANAHAKRKGTNGQAGVRHWAMDLTCVRDAAHMDAAMWELRSKGKSYDFVVLDLPDLSTSRAAPQIAALCDGALLVVAANRTRWQVAMHAKERLLDARVNLLGTVINRREYPIPQWLYQTL